MAEVQGHIQKIVYHNEENGYTVAYLMADIKQPLVTIVGILPMVREGEHIECEGDWIQHKKFGAQFEVQSFNVLLPHTKQGIIDYLGGRWIAGIGERFAKRIVDKFGLDTFDVIENEPERLLEVSGLGRRKMAQIVSSWQEHHQSREIVLFLQQYAISPVFATKIIKHYGADSIAKIKLNPYSLADDIVGISFLKADEIAQAMGISTDSMFRIESGLLYLLREVCQQQGHTAYPLEELIERSANYLKVDTDLTHQGISNLVHSKRVLVDYLTIDNQATAFVWLRFYYTYEKQIAENIQRILIAKPINKPDAEKNLQKVLDELKITLAEQQLQAVQTSLSSKIHIITGGAGTGKSTIIKVLVNTFEHYTEKVVLAAPTGRAAKRMNEVTQHKANTIHVLLQIGAFTQQNPEKIMVQPLDADVVIIDEVSMVDTALMCYLLRAIPDKAHVIFVGDADQLPSVGAGNVLKDMIATGIIACTRLTEIFRQAAESTIVKNAHAINEGEYPSLKNNKDSDFFFLEEHEPSKITQLIQDLITKRLPAAYNCNMLKDIQVLSPMNKGDLGTKALNEILQKACNSLITQEKNYLTFGSTIFCIGDKVIQTKNNYDKEVFNGDIGFISRIDKEDNVLWIDFEGRELEFSLAECIDLDLAYAISVHKYQGSECPAVIIPIHEAHYKLLFRNLLYTAVTRGKKLVILVGTKRALQQAIENDSIQQRYTGLQQALSPESYAHFPPIHILPMLGSEEDMTVFDV